MSDKKENLAKFLNPQVVVGNDDPSSAGDVSERQKKRARRPVRNKRTIENVSTALGSFWNDAFEMSTDQRRKAAAILRQS